MDANVGGNLLVDNCSGNNASNVVGRESRSKNIMTNFGHILVSGFNLSCAILAHRTSTPRHNIFDSGLVAGACLHPVALVLLVLLL